MRYNRYTPIGFAEVAFQWKTLLKLRANGFNDLQIVAVTPEVDYLAGASGELYLCIEDFYNWDRINTLGEENIDIAEDLCKNVDDIVLNIISGFPGIDLVSSRALFHPLKGFLDSLAMRMFPLEAVFKHIQPATVLCFHQDEYKISGANLLDKHSKRINGFYFLIRDWTISMKRLLQTGKPSPRQIVLILEIYVLEFRR